MRPHSTDNAQIGHITKKFSHKRQKYLTRRTKYKLQEMRKMDLYGDPFAEANKRYWRDLLILCMS